jgi:hypothetical protein
MKILLIVEEFVAIGWSASFLLSGFGVARTTLPSSENLIKIFLIKIQKKSLPSAVFWS